MIVEVTLPVDVGERVETNDIKELEAWLEQYDVPVAKVSMVSRRVLSIRWQEGYSVSYADLGRVVDGVQLHVGEIADPADKHVEVSDYYA